MSTRSTLEPSPLPGLEGERARTEPGRERSITLPWRVFYGVGVTVGAGIFALIGEILSVSGDHAPLAFLTAGVIAGFTGVSYMLLVREFPRGGFHLPSGDRALDLVALANRGLPGFPAEERARDSP